MPTVKRLCRRCLVKDHHVSRHLVIVSPRGTAHYDRSYRPDRLTVCGLDASGVEWWWPL